MSEAKGLSHHPLLSALVGAAVGGCITFAGTYYTMHLQITAERDSRREQLEAEREARHEKAPTYNARPSPTEIYSAILEERPMFREEVGRRYIGWKVNWNVLFNGVTRSDDNNVIVHTGCDAKSFYAPLIFFKANPNRYQFLNFIKGNAPILVRGTIKTVSETTIGLDMEDLQQVIVADIPSTDVSNNTSIDRQSLNLSEMNKEWFNPKPTPEDIGHQLKEATPGQVEMVGKSFIGSKVNWNLIFENGIEIDRKFHAICRSPTSDIQVGNWVVFDLPTEQNQRIAALSPHHKILVRGIISQASTWSITLAPAEVEQWDNKD